MRFVSVYVYVELSRCGGIKRMEGRIRLIKNTVERANCISVASLRSRFSSVTRDDTQPRALCAAIAEKSLGANARRWRER
jgi:hypothetical protein